MCDKAKLDAIVKRKIEELSSELHPKNIGERAQLAMAMPRYLILQKYVGINDLLEELGADTKELEEIVKKELEEARKLPLGV